MQRAGTTAAPTLVGEVAVARDDDVRLLADLRGGSEAAYVGLIERYHMSLVRLARLYVHASVAEDVVQETWIGVMRGLDRFEGRASFKTWLFRILVNRARTRGARDARTIDLSSIVRRETESDDPAVDPSRFRRYDDPYPGHWW